MTANPKDAIGDTKAALHLVPAALSIYASQAMSLGAAKYGPYNWRENKVQAHVYYAAALRHLAAWFDGEDADPESHALHLAHAAACLAILLDALATGNLIDDRPTPGATAELLAAVAAPAVKRDIAPPPPVMQTLHSPAQHERALRLRGYCSVCRTGPRLTDLAGV